ncbi:MAG: 2-oxo-4-hydroxy-4-carboxy-5-ureidoimidazoline decarboxylase [Betaproteobacteria bacterium]
MTVDQANALDCAAFISALGGIVEHSPWIAEEAWRARPFVDVEALHGAMMNALARAPIDTQLAVMRAHPELAGKAAIRGEMTADSKGEQGSAGLTQCSPREFSRLTALNRAYNAKFGFPFIVAVKDMDRATIIEHFERRLEHDRQTEFSEALAQIARIARLRLDALLKD